MAHFAQLDEHNIVIQVIVVNDDDCLDAFGNESEEVGIDFCSRLLGGRWIQTSYTGRIRGRYAGIGWAYDEENDVFIAPKPREDAVLNEQFDWVLPYDSDEEHLRKLIG